MTPIMEKEIFQQGKAVKDCLNYNEKALNKAAQLVRENCRSVLIAARGSSCNAGYYFKYVLENLFGMPVAFAAPSINTLYQNKLKLKEYAVIGISQSGAAEDVMAVLDNAKEQGALTISITNNLKSKICAMTDFHLYCNCGDEVSVAATKTFLTQMYILAQLAARVSQKQSFIESLAGIDKGIESVLALNSGIKEIAQQYKDADMMIVLARGNTFPISMEAALKLQETCYLNARCYAASDFVHGPFALVDQNTNLMLLAPKGPALPDMINMKNRLLNEGANVIIITDDENAAEGCTNRIILPQAENDYIAPFFAAVAVQLFACSLSLARGLNPDAPRGLKKVTVTK